MKTLTYGGRYGILPYMFGTKSDSATEVTGELAYF